MVSQCEQFGRRTFSKCTQSTILPEATHPPMSVCGKTTAGSRYNFRELRWSELGCCRSLFSRVWEFRVPCSAVVAFESSSKF